MDKIFFTLSVMVVLLLTEGTFLSASESPPPATVLTQNLQKLQGLSSTSGKRGSVRMVLGLFRHNTPNSYTVYYCTVKPRSGDVFTADQRDGCYNDVTLLLLDTGKWVLQSADNKWLIISEPLY